MTASHLVAPWIQDGRFQIKFKVSPSYAGNCPPLLIPKGAMEGSKGKESQSSAPRSLIDGTNPNSGIG